MKKLWFLLLAGCFGQMDVGYDASRPMILYSGKALTVEPVVREASEKLSSRNISSKAIVACMLCDNNAVAVILNEDVQKATLIRPEHEWQCVRVRVNSKVTSDELASVLQDYAQE